jgi:hypothetical protein
LELADNSLTRVDPDDVEASAWPRGEYCGRGDGRNRAAVDGRSAVARGDRGELVAVA